MSEIFRALDSDLELVCEFLLSQCRLNYKDKISQKRLMQIKAKVLKNEAKNAFFIAKDGDIKACICINKYDERISLVNDFLKGKGKIAEVSRCYVRQDLQQNGLGKKLFSKALEFAKNAGYNGLYLHTHRFLPYAFKFWQDRGFELFCDEKDRLKTLHMFKGV